MSILRIDCFLEKKQDFNFALQMKGTGSASSSRGSGEKTAAPGGALAESVLDEPDAEEQDADGGDG